jgi:NADPH:quinone reductase-like Zn-dependent oxidoreductase
MKAMLIRNYGSPDVFELGEVELPVIKDNEMLVRVSGSSVNPVDAGIRRGLLKSFIRLKLPAILGVDVSGEVVATGKSVSKFSVGDRVYAYMGLSRSGGYGEFIAMPENYASRIPDNLDTIDAGVVPGVGMTAYEAFTIHAPLARGMKVLINGATGGVGTYAIQIAKHFGTDVTAVCSSERAGLARQLGADKVIDYQSTDIFHLKERYDVILNCVRGVNFRKFKKLLSPGGHLIVITGSPLEIPLIKFSNFLSSRKTKSFFVKIEGSILEGLSRLIASGNVKPVIQKIYPWTELSKAHKAMEAGKIAGKIGIAINPIHV